MTIRKEFGEAEAREKHFALSVVRGQCGMEQGNVVDPQHLRAGGNRFETRFDCCSVERGNIELGELGLPEPTMKKSFTARPDHYRSPDGTREVAGVAE